MLVTLAGCTHLPTAQSASFVFPNSRMLEEGKSCFIDVARSQVGASSDEDLLSKLGDFYKHAGMNVTNELADPFVRENLPFVTFESFRPGQEIADFYDRAFRNAGWEEIRGILLLEYTNCGGDWLRVFAKEGQQVLVHVCGPMTLQETESATDLFTRRITLRFRGITPEELLGPDFKRNKGANQAMEAIGAPGSPQPHG